MRGPVTHLDICVATRGARTAARSSRNPSCSRVTPSAWHSRPGPAQSSRGSSSPRRSRHRVAGPQSARAPGSARPRRALVAADEVQAPVDAVRAIDVRAAGRPEHRSFLRRCRSAEAMARRVAYGVGLDLDDPPADAVDEQLRAHELGRDLVHAPREEVACAELSEELLRPDCCALASSSRRARLPRSATSKRPCLRLLGDALREVERLVEDAATAAAASWPMSWRIVRSVREATIGSGMPSTQTRVRRRGRALPRRAAPASRSCRRARTSRSRGRPSGSRLQPCADYPQGAAQRVHDALLVLRSMPAWNGIASVRGCRPRSPGTSPSRKPKRSRMYGWRWIDGRYGASAMPLAPSAPMTPSRSTPARKLDDVDEPRAVVVGVVRERQLDVRRPRAARRSARATAARRARISSSFSSCADAERRRDVVEAVVEAEPAVLEPARRLERGPGCERLTSSSCSLRESVVTAPPSPVVICLFG